MTMKKKVKRRLRSLSIFSNVSSKLLVLVVWLIEQPRSCGEFLPRAV